MKLTLLLSVATAIVSPSASSSDAGSHAFHSPLVAYKESEMTKADPSPTNMPPDIARYIQGAPPESRQFDFLLGQWKVAATAFNPDGTLLREYAASWEARALNAGRMVMDDYRAQAPNGMDVSSFVTLRTWCPATGRWEITGLAAHQSAMPMQWHGQWQDGEMRLEAKGQDPQGREVETRIRFFAIAAASFTWESQTSRDGGKTWTRTALLRASRVSSEAQ